MTRDIIEPQDPLTRLDQRLQCIRAVGYLLTRFTSAPETDFVPAGCGAIISSEANAMMEEIDTLRGM